MKKIIILLLINSVFYNLSKVTENIEQVKIGNFALPTSQQPGPLIGFGQNIVDKGDFQLFTYVDYLRGKKEKLAEVSPSILYGIKDNLSIFIELSSVVKFQVDDTISSKGLEDLLAQLEYAFYYEETTTTIDQITLVVNMTFPTAKKFQIPPTGFGSSLFGAPSFFLGFTASHFGTQWYPFASSGVILTTKHKGTKFGNQFLYQCGLSRNICYVSNKWLLNWMIELNGVYQQRDKILGVINKNSGGNQIALGASLWFSTQRLIIQAGISGFISQHLFGTQSKDKYYAALDIGWKF